MVFRGQLDTMSIYQNNVQLRPKAYDLSHGLLTRFTEPGKTLFMGLESNQKAVDYPCDSHATAAQVGTSRLAL